MNSLPREHSAFRPGGHPHGFQRVLEPKGALPQAAWRLDVSLPLFANEVLIAVDRLHLDSASFRQLREAHDNDAAKIAATILGIVRERGKMHNPETQSGGMLQGRILQKGDEAYHVPEAGTAVATLVSLTLTPLILEKIESVDLESGEVRVVGHAILPATAAMAPVPEDFSPRASLRIFDVCGAPAWARRLVHDDDRVLILGAGHSGMLAAAAVREVIDRHGLTLTDLSERALKKASVFELAGHSCIADAQSPQDFCRVLGIPEDGYFDLVINTCNAPDTEAATLLAARPGARVLFFNMATQFQRAVLGAEGLGRDLSLMMGNGFAEGHWQYALDLVRSHESLREFFEEGARA